MDHERVAKLINMYRVVPRVVLASYYAFFMYAWFFIVQWFIDFDWNSLPSDPVVGSVAAGAIAGFPAIILGLLTKILKDLTHGYWNGDSSPTAHAQGEGK